MQNVSEYLTKGISERQKEKPANTWYYRVCGLLYILIKGID